MWLVARACSKPDSGKATEADSKMDELENFCWRLEFLGCAEDNLKYACVVNFLAALDAGDAKRKRKHLNSWKLAWPNKHFKSWKAADLKNFAEFKAKHSPESALADIFLSFATSRRL